MSKKRFEIVHNIASPYRVHLFGEMHRQLTERGIDFHVHFMSDMSRGYDDRPKSWRNPQMDFPYTYWRDWGYSHYAFNPGIIWHLFRHRPDWLLVGSCYDTFTGIFSSLLCPARQAKICWLEGNTKSPNKLRGAAAGKAPRHVPLQVCGRPRDGHGSVHRPAPGMFPIENAHARPVAEHCGRDPFQTKERLAGRGDPGGKEAVGRSQG